MLSRVQAEPGVRLACQLRPARDLALLPLLPPHATLASLRRGPTRAAARSVTPAAMFVDMRGSTRRAERRLPYDTVFLINQFLNAVSSAVVEAGGQPNEVLGDGLLALFGMTGVRKRLPRRYRRVQRVVANVDRLNEALRTGRSCRCVSGSAQRRNRDRRRDRLRRHAQFTVIGDVVNVAAAAAGPDPMQ